jgi:hypothetical protein
MCRGPLDRAGEAARGRDHIDFDDPTIRDLEAERDEQLPARCDR